MSVGVPSIDTNCQSLLSCDIPYRLDWTFLARLDNLDCSTVSVTDPCFGSHACICDNGYFKISKDMPEKPDDYQGDSDILAAAEAQELETNSDSDDSSDDGWVIPVVITIVILVLGGAGVGAFFLYKRMKAKKEARMKT